MFFQAVRQSRIVGGTRAGARVNYDVHCGQFVLMQSKRFANQALDAVTTNRVTDESSGDR